MARSSSTKLRQTLGLMSGTSLDGIDVAAIATDGRRHVIPGPALTVLYPAAFRDRLRSVLGGAGEVAAVPAERRTWQSGDGALLARLTGADVVADFRSADVAAGGEGAPLAPLYHAALAADLPKPLATLNLGGVGNVTWIGPDENNILAFDTGPGNALIDDW